MSKEFWEVFLGSATGAAVVSSLLKIVEILFSEWKLKNSEIRTSRLQLSDEIIKICSEGNSHHHSISPRDEEHIKYVAYQARYFDKKIYEKLLEYLRTWSTCANWKKGDKLGPLYSECNALNSAMLDYAMWLKR